MSFGETAALLLALVVLASVALPLFRRGADERERLAAAMTHAQELHSEREMVLASLKDLEDDRATGKLGEDDHAELKRKLTAQAVEIMKEIDRLERERAEAAALPPPRPFRRPHST